MSPRCDEGTEVTLSSEPGVTFCWVDHFGTYLRLAGELPEGAKMVMIVTLTFKE